MADGSEDEVLWAARLGELCGRAGDGPVPERALLDAWMDLVGTTAACLSIVRRSGSEESFCRGLQAWGREPAGPGLSLIDGAPLGVEGTLVRIAVGEPEGPWAELISGGGNAALHRRLSPLLPLVERALLRLARDRSDSADSAARRAWERAPGAMLLLNEGMQVLALNPAASRHPGLAVGSSLPDWVRVGVEASQQSSDSVQRVWTVAGGGVEYNISLVAVDPAEATPGRWLLSLMPGGPSLDERVEVAAERHGLTMREAEVLELVAEGLTNGQVAGALELAEATVKFHLNGVMRKVGVGSRTELLARLHSVHLVDAGADVPASARRLRTGWIWLGDDGIVRVRQAAGTRITLDDIVAFNTAVESYSVDGAPVFVFSDASGVKSTTPEAAKKASAPAWFVGALGVKGGSAVSRALVNMWLRLFRPPYPTRLFEDEEAAVAWLVNQRRLRLELPGEGAAGPGTGPGRHPGGAASA